MSVVYFSELCSTTSNDWLFWSRNGIWNTANPDFTLCFQYTIFNWIPQLFLYISSAALLPGLLLKRNIHYLQRGSLNIFKSIIISLLLMVNLINFCAAIADKVSHKNPPLALFLSSLLSLLSTALVIYLNRQIFKKGIHTSAVLTCYWFILLIINILEMYSRYRRFALPNPDILRTVTKTIEFSLVFVSFICSCFSDKMVFQNVERLDSSDEECEIQPLIPMTFDQTKNTQKIEICPELHASFISRITYSWLTRMIIQGFRRPLTSKDLFSLRNCDTCATIIPRMISEWNVEVDKTTLQKKHVVKHRHSNGGYQALPSSETEHHEMTEQKGEATPSLCKALFHAVGHEYAFGAIYKLIYDLTNFLMPAILAAFIAFIEDIDDFLWHGVLFVVCLFVVAMARTCLYQHYLHTCLVAGMRARTAIIGIIYRKALRLSATSRKGSTVGQIVNLMSVDTQKIQDVPFHLHQTWSAPLTIFVSFFFLWQQLGPSVLAGLALLFCLIPINVFIGSKSKNLQIQQMRIKDKRIKMMTEILSGMKILKLYAWEKSFEGKIKEMRDMECKILRRAMYLNSFSAVSWFCAPLLVTLSSFAVYVLSSPTNVLTPTIAFVSISLINIINVPISQFPGAIILSIQAYVSLKRINTFLIEEELDPDHVEQSSFMQEPIKIVDGNFSWGKEDQSILTNINMDVSEGALVAIVGTVGCGKSSLINAMLGEMHKISGAVLSRGPIAYVPQQAWCQNSSVQENILFGKPMSRSKYQRVLETCDLCPDLLILPSGDLTEIGEKGINLSGGQKQRISLARAVYQDASIYLFDDPLSAVDSHVGKHIFDNVIGPTGVLNKKTRVLVTHGVTYLPKMDKIFVMKDGEISETGTYKELLENSGPFADFLRTYLEQDGEETDDDENVENEEKTIKEELRRILSRSPSVDNDVSSEHSKTQSSLHQSSHRRRSSALSSKGKINKKDTESNTTQKNKLISEEIAQIGGVKLSVFMTYLRSATFRFALLVLASYTLFLVSSVIANMFLSSWSEQAIVNGTQDIDSRNYFLSIYGSLGAVQAIFILIQNFALAYGTFCASQTLHHLMLKGIIRAPNVFFDVTPSGRILNRIGKDVDTVDINIPTAFRIWLQSGARVISSIVLVSVASPYFIIALIPLSLIYFFIQRFYICTSRQLKRIDSIKRSPIYSHFQESILGAPSIRAYKVAGDFIGKCDLLTDQNQMAWYPNIVSYRWMQFYLETIGNIMILLSAVFAIVTKDTIGPGLAGLSVSYSFQITTGLAVMVRTACDLESYVVAVERIQEYTEIESEAPWDNEEKRPSFDWPQKGKVEFYNYSVRYRPGLDLVLRNLNVVINSGDKIGIVGRTGAGKSSLALALFRLIEPAEGSIFIDDVDISELGLHDLRSKITIIPQDPVLFSGTLRMNLDPFNCHSDAELWVALDSSFLKTFVSQLPQGLDFSISESGDNLSVGQRQLICLARALLKKTKVLVLDEATAAVDLETDDLIQSSIRRQFKSCTVLTIAHRLNTIMDYDKVIVLDRGQIKELDTPGNLLANSGSIFYAMAVDAGII